MHFLRTGLLMAVLTVIFMLVGYVVGGQTGMLIAFGVSLIMHLVGYWSSDTMVLRMHGATQVDEKTAPELHRIVGELAANARLPMPRVCIMHNPQPNAFATGRDPEHASVCATTGLLELLSKEEVAGVMAHELAHVKNRDTLTMALAATLAGSISMLANWGLWFGGRQSNGRSPLGPIGVILVALAAPFAAMMVQMAISRSREYAADDLGSEICQRPLWLATALKKLEQSRRKIRNPTAEANPASAHMFIVNPLSGRNLDNLFITHPRTENRVARLVEIARRMGQISDQSALPEVLAPAGGPKGPWG